MSKITWDYLFKLEKKTLKNSGLGIRTLALRLKSLSLKCDRERFALVFKKKRSKRFAPGHSLKRVT